MMHMNTDYGWFIFALLVLLPSFLILAWSWRWWKEGRYSFDRFDHLGKGGAYDFNAGYLYPFGPHRGTPPKNYQRSDERIIDEINDRLTAHGLIDVSQVEVLCQDGLVTLMGTVEDRRTRRIVEDVVDSVAGVMDVDNRLEIGSKDQSKVTPQLPPEHRASENLGHH